MREFKDCKDQSWPIELNGLAIKRVLDLLKVDLGKPLEGNPPLLTRIGTDIVFLVDLLYVLCKPQADERSISDVQFAERLGGDALKAGHDSLMEELVDFFQRLGRAEVVKTAQTQRAILGRALEVVDGVMSSEEFGRNVEEALEQLGKRCLASLRLPEQTPRGEPSAN